MERCLFLSNLKLLLIEVWRRELLKNCFRCCLNHFVLSFFLFCWNTWRELRNACRERRWREIKIEFGRAWSLVVAWEMRSVPRVVDELRRETSLLLLEGEKAFVVKRWFCFCLTNLHALSDLCWALWCFYLSDWFPFEFLGCATHSRTVQTRESPKLIFWKSKQLLLVLAFIRQLRREEIGSWFSVFVLATMRGTSGNCFRNFRPRHWDRRLRNRDYFNLFIDYLFERHVRCNERVHYHSK